MKVKKSKKEKEREDLTNMNLDSFLQHFEIQSTYENDGDAEEESGDEEGTSKSPKSVPSRLNLNFYSYIRSPILELL